MWNDYNSIDHKWSQCLGRLVSYHPVNISHSVTCIKYSPLAQWLKPVMPQPSVYVTRRIPASYLGALGSNLGPETEYREVFLSGLSQ
jgi:hypothetical protein